MLLAGTEFNGCEAREQVALGFVQELVALPGVAGLVAEQGVDLGLGDLDVCEAGQGEDESGGGVGAAGPEGLVEGAVAQDGCDGWAAPRFPDYGIDVISCCGLPVQVLVECLLRGPVADG